MDETTIHQLNEINRRFYEKYAESFDATRGSAWAGWEELAPHLTENMHVLDVGCGNGRFALFVREKLGDKPFHYYGIDSSEALLEKARNTLADLPYKTLQASDILMDSLPNDRFEMVVLFGVLHHIPGAEHRETFMRMLAERVAPGGMLAFTAWRFYENPRFRDRITSWGVDLRDRVETNDYLLDWQGDKITPRYCHYVDDAEHERLIKATEMMVMKDYRADGSDRRTNRYTMLVRLVTS